MGSHSVTFHQTQVNTSRFKPRQRGWHSIYLTWRDGRLSWPRWPATCQDGLPACRWSPIQVLTQQCTAGSWTRKLLTTNCCCCCHRLAGKGCSFAPWWPRLTARLQTSTGDRLLSSRIWSTHLLWGRLVRRCHWLLGGGPRDRLTWQLSALWAGTSSGSRAMWPKRTLRRMWVLV